MAFGLTIILLEALTAVPMTLTQARLESLRFVLTNLAVGLSRLVLCIYLVAGLEWGIWGFLYAQAIVTVVSGIYLTYRELRIGSIYPFGKIAILLAITALCYALSLLCGHGIALNTMTADEFAELSRWEKITDAWNRIQWLSNIAKMGVLCLWGVLIWYSGVLSQEDKALAVRVIQRRLQKLHLYNGLP